MVFGRVIKLFRRFVFWSCVLMGALSLVVALLCVIYWPTLDAKMETAKASQGCTLRF